jgi:condensin complex subunit 1
VELEKGNNGGMRDHELISAKQSDSEAKADTSKEPDDLEMIGGTSEDDFSEAIALIRSPSVLRSVLIIREKELLFGTQSLLGRYGPLLVEICSKPDVYKVVK